MPVDDSDRRMLGISMWRWETLSYVVTTLGALGIVLAVFQYMQQLEAGRSRETLAMIEVWEVRGYRDSFNELSDDMLSYWETIPKADIEFAKTNANAAENLRNGLYKAVILAQQHKEERFERVVYFFNRLGLCIEANLCSSHTAGIFFKDPVDAFLSNFEPHLEDTRKVLPGYASGVFLLSRSIN